jgi:translation initiation factor IF-1
MAFRTSSSRKVRFESRAIFAKGNDLSRDDLVEMEGKVVEVLVGGNFRIDVQGGHSVLAHLAGRMRRNRIRVVLGDQVTVAVSPYDPGRGLITYRAK